HATGKPGVAMVTSGPGATNIVTPLADAYMDSIPMVCITGQVPLAAIGSDAFQEADAIALTLSATKWSYQITRPEEVREVVRKAFVIARSGRPGPVLIEITRDAQTGLVDAQPEPAAPVWNYPARHEDLSGLAQAAEVINTAQRPILMIGQGVTLSGAEAQVQALAERAGLPVASTLLGLSAFDVEHPLYVGMLGMHGNYAPNVLTNEADVILAVGMRFDDRVTGRSDRYAPDARIVHVDIDPAEVDRHIRPEVALIGDARKVLEALNPLIAERRHEAWRGRFEALAEREREMVIEPELCGGSAELRMGEVVDALSKLTDGNAVLVSDVGQHQMAAARYYRFSRRASHVTSGGLGTMGFGVPAALGASLAAGDRPVIAVVGDGGFQMTLQELGTLMQEQLPVKIVILNNEYLGMVRQWQELFFEERYSQVAMANPDFVTLASSYAIPAQRVQSREQLLVAMREALATPGPYLLEVCVARTDNVFPMVPAGAAIDEIRLS
ncbi:MAG: biosynthetic-type acetolactate synthase large subunit, partial [Gammaproteobacteria bacterium]|nr:biosynthetic-type acetolactate synthase large subunit [Gammaproteobacteria bacterium]